MAGSSPVSGAAFRGALEPRAYQTYDQIPRAHDLRVDYGSLPEAAFLYSLELHACNAGPGLHNYIEIRPLATWSSNLAGHTTLRVSADIGEIWHASRRAFEAQRNQEADDFYSTRSALIEADAACSEVKALALEAIETKTQAMKNEVFPSLLKITQTFFRKEGLPPITKTQIIAGSILRENLPADKLFKPSFINIEGDWREKLLDETDERFLGKSLSIRSHPIQNPVALPDLKEHTFLVLVPKALCKSTTNKIHLTLEGEPKTVPQFGEVQRAQETKGELILLGSDTAQEALAVKTREKTLRLTLKLFRGSEVKKTHEYRFDAQDLSLEPNTQLVMKLTRDENHRIKPLFRMQPSGDGPAIPFTCVEPKEPTSRAEDSFDLALSPERSREHLARRRGASAPDLPAAAAAAAFKPPF